MLKWQGQGKKENEEEGGPLNIFIMVKKHNGPFSYHN
jgi:hypothetical protein